MKDLRGGLRVETFSILLVLVLASCSKNSQMKSNASQERDTVAGAQELRDSTSRLLLNAKDVASEKKSSHEAELKEKGLPTLDTIVGTIYVSGNEPFTRLTLALIEGTSNMYIEADTTQSKQLRKLQGRVVKVFGAVVKNGTGDFFRVKEFSIVQ